MSETTKVENDAPFDRIYRWKNNPKRMQLVGRRCRILARGTTFHSVLIEFEDGERVITSARATMKVREET